MDENIKSRIDAIIDYYGISSNKFETLCGLSKSYLQRIKNDVGSSKIKSILTNFPDIDPWWLLTGEGEMLRQRDEPKEIIEITANEKSFNTNADGIIKELTATIRSQQEMIKQLTEKLLGL